VPDLTVSRHRTEPRLQGFLAQLLYMTRFLFGCPL
jgi:hypothetical protein